MTNNNNKQNTVLLVYENGTARGPGKLVRNLTKGLEAIGVDVVTTTTTSNHQHHVGVTQFCEPELLNGWHQTKRPILLGPNLFVLPTDNPVLCKMFNDFTVPSQWVKELYERFELMKGKKNITVWPVGIDTEEWKPKQPVEHILDCFIYFKNRTEQDLRMVEALCNKNNLRYKVLKYGNYQEHELKRLCEEARFVILLTGTESQGIAYMEILSTDTPAYVFNSPTWKSDDDSVSAPASSVPYWDSTRCGMLASNDNNNFEDFLHSLDSFSPRDYILEHHTLELSAREYFNLLIKL